LSEPVRHLPGAIWKREDSLWLLVWLAGMGALWLWDAMFLNYPAFLQLRRAFLNSLAAASAVVAFSLALGWGTGLALHFLDRWRNRTLYLLLTFLLTVIRSVPQIVGLLIGYVFLTIFMQKGWVQDPFGQILWMSFVLSLFVFPELTDLIRERIAYYRTLDFYPAMLCCGIPEGRIINREILWKNSLTHLINKMISTFGAAIFLQCSIDFIVSVGLSTDVSLSNFPVSLGSLLATMESKQDILAISSLFTDISYVRELFIRHLQGLSVAFIIVFTLLCIYKISNGIVKRYNL
jgi:ABC-type dipeptide/oligopeptide/nickel transport system permease subunit